MKILLSKLNDSSDEDKLMVRRIGYNATISAPHMHAHAAEILLSSLSSDGGGAILDVGSGSGYRKLGKYHYH